MRSLTPVEDRGSIGFAEKLLALLDEGAYTTTYKFAVLLALIDLCLEQSTASGGAPTSVTTTQLAEKTIELYWPHVVSFPSGAHEVVLRQSAAGSQAEIVGLIRRFRGPGAATLQDARLASPDGYERLKREVEWKLVQMPLPRLQMLGSTHDPFIYQVSWDDSIRRGEFNSPDFDNNTPFIGDAGEHLVRLAGLLRPLVQRQRAAMVARLNRGAIEDARLEEFLFGAERIPLGRVRVRSASCRTGAASIASGRSVDLRTWTTSSRGHGTRTTVSTTSWRRIRGATTRSVITFLRPSMSRAGGAEATLTRATFRRSRSRRAGSGTRRGR